MKKLHESSKLSISTHDDEENYLIIKTEAGYLHIDATGEDGVEVSLIDHFSLKIEDRPKEEPTITLDTDEYPTWLVINETESRWASVKLNPKASFPVSYREEIKMFWEGVIRLGQKYVVLEFANHDQFSWYVTAGIEFGFEPVGGVACLGPVNTFDELDPKFYYCQAMVKR